MERLNTFFECLLPTTKCNLACEYCYIIQEHRRSMRQIPLDYDVEHIIRALSAKRLGGKCFFSICGAGETLLQEECIELVHALLKEGHFINITTNGTVKKKIDAIIDLDEKLLENLHFSFSLHYLELIKHDLLDVFFRNVQCVREKKCSFLVQINLYDGYLEYLDEIKNLCYNKIGAYPQVAVTRLETAGDVIADVKLHTALDNAEYGRVGKRFDSPLFDFTMKNFNVKRREFCYAGEWAFSLDLKTGDLRACYHSGRSQNIFKDIERPIRYEAVGRHCNSLYCINSSHFLSLGCIPSIDTPSYAELRNRKEAAWYNANSEMLLNIQFKDYKEQYGCLKKLYVDGIGYLKLLKEKVKPKFGDKMDDR